MAKSDPQQPETRGVAERSFTCSVEGRSVPVAVWLPMSRQRSPLVLVGHGGSGHKRSEFVLDVVAPLVREHGFAVAAIDGPVHGDRRATPAAPEAVRDEFRALWEAGGSVEPMVADWRGVLDALCSFREIDASAVAYYGLSMGTAYGLPFLAGEPRIHAAAIGMWGTSRANSQRLMDDARRVRCPTMFSLQWDDPLFTREGQFEVFDALASQNKHMSIYPGGHLNPSGARLDDIVYFLARELAHRARSSVQSP
ncbi:dienelactone hydrolase family protein [Caenimonas soli]|uniref:dienelactone hydrolase family protein n=1 Tax=Caenimonas soli TaxID=2735555 RepID=UPI001551F018|nr:dienelactone hydrolase family protein [Caenimonas soli]NPC54267.1 alpha/beta hydrolase [Caenimonas soli]